MVEISLAVCELFGDELHLRITQLLKYISNCKKTVLVMALVHLPTPESINTI